MTFSFDFSQTSKFFDNLESFKLGLPELIENEMSYSALNLIMDIKNLTPVDTGALKMAWTKTNIYKAGSKYQTYNIDILNPKEYASYMEDGFYTSTPERRFVPGSWQGNKFIYEKGAKTGMVLKRKWIEGKHMYRISVNKWERYFEIDWTRALSKYAKSKKVK